MNTPSWFEDNEILIINAATCGINKDGHEQYIVNTSTGSRSTDTINDALAQACQNVHDKKFTNKDISYSALNDAIEKDIFVPKYYDKTFLDEAERLVGKNKKLTLKSLGDLVNDGEIMIIHGHGSPSSDQRVGDIPYIKVSDLRAGVVNINPTNMIPQTLAERFWRGNNSGLQAYDLLSPERASKNIGEFCVLMPGQENVVLTKEILIIRATQRAQFDQFYLMWALSLSAVKMQWERIIFIQTNREDVGDRILEIKIPYSTNKKHITSYSKPFKDYYQSMDEARLKFISALNKSQFKHHIHLGEI